MEKGILSKIKVFYFMVVAVMMYYFLTEIINLGVHVTYRHAFAFVLAASAILAFLYNPNIARGITVFKSALIYSVPLFVTIVMSLFIWFVGTVDIEVISRGLSSTLIYTNMLSFALAASAFLYIFGEKGIWYNLIAILAANILMILTIIAEYGMGNYFSELIALITSFAAETGDIIIQAEVHELAFCLGAYLIYMFFKPKRDIMFYILLALSLFCFLSAFKRIGIIAIAICLIIAWILKFIARYSRETAYGITMFLSVVTVIILVGYIALIKLDAFVLLEQMGINTSGRVEIYNAVDKFYDFSPGFLGNGIGFLTYQLNTNMKVGVAAVHNDFLQYFIDLGFWGYILWLLSMTVMRTWYFGSKGKTDNAILTFVLILYLVIVSSTDNTMNYPLLTSVLAILMIGHGFDEDVRKQEIKMFGCVSEPNKKKESGTIL
ncbi:MAG: O-antigen ligase family protein [Clostridia bacterium]|nr:O-antigen ligase family protein [Clostridia bacterium]